jgi:hypothetical protein
MERVKGIEPSYSAWKADVLPLNYTRNIKFDYVESTSMLNFNCSPRRGHPQIESLLRQDSIIVYYKEMVPMVGVEPTLPKEHDFESCASANSATSALLRNKQYYFLTWCRGPESNRYGSHLPQDFKSCASASSATPALFYLEEAPGFEPGNKGFADLCLTTWLCLQ